MKKKTRASGGARPAKRGKRAQREPKAARERGSTRASAPRISAARDAAKLTIRRLRAQLAEARAQIQELQASADTDFLLGILNRRGFERELKRALAYIKRYHVRGALIVFDVDRLKPINDTFGHAAGDDVLKRIVATLSTQVRSSDVIGRLGGDEFAVLLWNVSESDARTKAAALETAVDGLTFTFRGETVASGASTGVALLSAQTDPARAFEEADCAMYVRKAQRRHRA